MWPVSASSPRRRRGPPAPRQTRARSPGTWPRSTRIIPRWGPCCGWARSRGPGAASCAPCAGQMFDHERGTLAITRGLTSPKGRRYAEGPTKTKNRRTIPLTPEGLAELIGHRARREMLCELAGVALDPGGVHLRARCLAHGLGAVSPRLRQPPLTRARRRRRPSPRRLPPPRAQALFRHTGDRGRG